MKFSLAILLAAFVLAGCGDEKARGPLTPVLGADVDHPLKREQPGDQDPAPPKGEWPVAKPKKQEGGA
jgi:hypothetical protein